MHGKPGATLPEIHLQNRLEKKVKRGLNLKEAGKPPSAPLAAAGYYSLPVPLCRGPSGRAAPAASKRSPARRRRWHQGAGRNGRPERRRGSPSLSDESGPDPDPPFVCVASRGRVTRAADGKGRGRSRFNPAPGPGPRSPGDAALSPRYSARGLSRTRCPVRPPDGLNSADGPGREGAGPASPTPETPRARLRLAAPKTRGTAKPTQPRHPGPGCVQHPPRRS